MALRDFWVWLWGCILVLCCSTALAQTVYKWTDENGVIHFADIPPAGTGSVEERHLPAPPPAPRAAPQPAEAKAEAAARPTGPARIIVASHKAPRTSPSALHVTGEVRNVGGSDAQRVAVTISAVDSQQGNPCLSEEISVQPSTLEPGATGTFAADLDSPCLIGQSRVEIAPLWD